MADELSLIKDALDYLKIPKDDWLPERNQAWRQVEKCLLLLREDYEKGRRNVPAEAMEELVDALDTVFLGLRRAQDYKCEVKWVENEKISAEVIEFDTTGSGTMSIDTKRRTEYVVLGDVLHEMVHINIDVRFYHGGKQLTDKARMQVADVEHPQIWQILAREVERHASDLTGKRLDLGRSDALILEYNATGLRPDKAFLDTMFTNSEDLQARLNKPRVRSSR